MRLLQGAPALPAGDEKQQLSDACCPCVCHDAFALLALAARTWGPRVRACASAVWCECALPPVQVRVVPVERHCSELGRIQAAEQQGLRLEVQQMM